MPTTSTSEEISQLKRRLEILKEHGENELPQRLKEARSVVADPVHQLSEITGRASATQITRERIVRTHFRRPTISEEKLEIRILSLLHVEGQQGMNGKTIAEKLNLNPCHIHKWIKNHPTVLKREGKGRGTRIFVP